MVCLLHSKLQGKLFFLKGLVSLKCTKWQKAKGSLCLSNQDRAVPGTFQSQPTEVNVIGALCCKIAAFMPSAPDNRNPWSAVPSGQIPTFLGRGRTSGVGLLLLLMGSGQ